MSNLNTCIPVEIANSLKAAIQSGEVSIKEISALKSEERRAIFEKYLKDSDLAKKINVGFEARMNSKTAGILNKYILREMGKTTPAIKKSLVDKVSKLDNILNPEESKPFLSDLVEQKLGAKLSKEEAQTLFKYADDVKQAQTTLKEAMAVGKVAQDSPLRNDFAMKELLLQSSLDLLVLIIAFESALF